MELKFKLWLENNKGELVIGEGILNLLNTIKKNGSISEASKELDMSYRAAWGKLKKVEDRLGYKLVERKTGGIGGGGTNLTEKGEILLDKFDKINEETQKAIMEIYNKYF